MKKRIAVILVILMYIFTPFISSAENLIRNSDFGEVNGKDIVNWAKGENNPDYFNLLTKESLENTWEEKAKIILDLLKKYEK